MEREPTRTPLPGAHGLGLHHFGDGGGAAAMGAGIFGWLGVAISGSQPASAAVAALPSSSPLRIAAIGRQ
jgi:hypothetical protein